MQLNQQNIEMLLIPVKYILKNFCTKFLTFDFMAWVLQICQSHKVVQGFKKVPSNSLGQEVDFLSAQVT